MEYIILARPVLANEHYIKGRDRMCAQLHFNECQEIRLKLENKLWYGHLPKSVETIHEIRVTLLWNRQNYS